MAKILVVDDEKLIRALLEQLLIQENHDVILASDGDTAISVARTDKPDLIILDMNMPKMTGWEVAPVLRSHPDTKQIPIIALTADSTTEGRDIAHGAGCDLFVTKPVNPEKLKAAVTKVLNQ